MERCLRETSTETSTPTHNGATATGNSTQKYNAAVSIGTCGDHSFNAIAYKSGYIDSDVSTQDYNLGSCGGMGPMGPSSTVTIFSVWDGDWAILEEYTSGNTLVEKYLQGYHGLVKTFQTVAYYYQDELGSTSHLADATGALIESYHYDVYGKPKVYDSAGNFQAGATPVAKDLFTGQRWISQIGLYDDRNRFMSPDLGRFLQPDPIGFKGDASNLYRYCGNDWANRTDPMGTQDASRGSEYAAELGQKIKENAKEQSDSRSFQEKMSASEVEHQANVDSQHDTNMRNARSEAHNAGMEGESRRLGFGSLANYEKVAQKAVKIQGNQADVETVGGAVSQVLHTYTGMGAVSHLQSIGKEWTIQVTHDNYTFSPAPFRSNIDPNFGRAPYGLTYRVPTVFGRIPYTLTRQVAHEMAHAVYLYGADRWSENRAVEFENRAMFELGEPFRTEW